MSDTGQTQKQIAADFDAQCAKVLREGQEVLTAQGEVIKMQPSPAMMNVIRQRIKDLGITAIPRDGTPAGDLIQSAVRAGIKFDGKPVAMPDIDLDTDDAATAM